MVRVCNSCRGEFEPTARQIKCRDWKCLPCTRARLPSRNSNHRLSLPDRFWSMVRKGPADECWPWTAGTVKGGYGKFSIDGVYRQSHRVSWEIANGPIPSGLWVLHRCDNPPCVNPSHLFLGTVLDNVRDMYAKGRQPDRKRAS